MIDMSRVAVLFHPGREISADGMEEGSFPRHSQGRNRFPISRKESCSAEAER